MRCQELLRSNEPTPFDFRGTSDKQYDRTRGFGKSGGKEGGNQQTGTA